MTLGPDRSDRSARQACETGQTAARVRVISGAPRLRGYLSISTLERGHVTTNGKEETTPSEIENISAIRRPSTVFCQKNN